VLVVSLALGTVASVWPELIRPRSYWVFATFVLGLILSVVAWFLGSGNAAEPQHQDSIVAGSGNSGHPIIAHGDVYLGQNSASSLEMKKEIQAGPPAVQREVEELDLELVPHGDRWALLYFCPTLGPTLRPALSPTHKSMGPLSPMSLRLLWRDGAAVVAIGEVDDGSLECI
jgi:hypothetical protein